MDLCTMWFLDVYFSLFPTCRDTLLRLSIEVPLLIKKVFLCQFVHKSEWHEAILVREKCSIGFKIGFIIKNKAILFRKVYSTFSHYIFTKQKFEELKQDMLFFLLICSLSHIPPQMTGFVSIANVPRPWTTAFWFSPGNTAELLGALVKLSPLSHSTGNQEDWNMTLNPSLMDYNIGSFLSTSTTLNIWVLK
jgi:hypothetical protein